MAIEQAEDFRAESSALYELLKGRSNSEMSESTFFKKWTTNDVLQHLFYWNEMAALQVVDEAELMNRLKQVMAHKHGMRGCERDHFSGLEGRDLLDAWYNDAHSTANVFASADPKQRLKWAGPDMSARSSITARLMETWAHGQEVYDHFGVHRQNADRIKNIAVLGVNTFGWTYKTRGETPPEEMPYVALTSPSNEIWEFGNPSQTDKIAGLAEEFCQVVTQTRNIADTALEVTGAVAKDWMSKAQCFAGGPETPPAPGTRGIRRPNPN